MAKTPKPAAMPTTLPQSFDPEARYRVVLKKHAMVGSMIIRPSHDDVVVIGAIAEKIKDVLVAAERI